MNVERRDPVDIAKNDFSPEENQQKRRKVFRKEKDRKNQMSEVVEKKVNELMQEYQKRNKFFDEPKCDTARKLAYSFCVSFDKIKLNFFV